MSHGGPPADPDARLVKLVHDLRTPLTIVQGFSELLGRQAGRLDPETLREYATRIAAAANEMKDLLDAERASRPLEE